MTTMLADLSEVFDMAEKKSEKEEIENQSPLVKGKDPVFGDLG